MGPNVRTTIAVLAICGAVALSVVALEFAVRLAEATGNATASPDTAGVVGYYTSLALDASGNPVVSYYHGGAGDLKMLHCGNPTCSASNIIASPDTPGIVGLHTSLALDAAGNPVVSYTSYDITGTLKVLHCGNPSCTAGNTIASPDPPSDVVLGLSLVLDADGNPVVSYYDDTNDDLKVLHCGNPSCTSDNTIASPDVLGFSGAYSSLALDAAGNPVVSYFRTGDLRVLHCGNPACTSGNTTTSPDTAGLVGEHTSLALDPDDRPVVSYRDQTNDHLKVLYCGNSTCTSGNIIASPDTTGQVGLYTSLALSASGNPIVSYYDAGNGDLKVLHCGNPWCGAGNTVTSPDGAGDVGSYTSLILDALGNPIISYHDATNGDLKVLICSDPACTGVKPTPSPTPTPAPTPVPEPVGGIAELPEVAGTALEATDSGPSVALLSGIAAVVATALALGGAAWYATRRWGR